MKIISGKLKGRNILGYEIEGTRPTMDRVKESIFGSIQNYILNATVLDLFAGSGNLGIEAYSNGASFVYLNDCNKKCINTIKNNLINFNAINNFSITCMDYMECLKYLMNKNIKFDLIFLDPPYKMDICSNIIKFIQKNSLLKENGLIICEITNNNLLDNYNNIMLIKTKKYGDKYVNIYQNRL